MKMPQKRDYFLNIAWERWPICSPIDLLIVVGVSFHENVGMGKNYCLKSGRGGVFFSIFFKKNMRFGFPMMDAYFISLLLKSKVQQGAGQKRKHDMAKEILLSHYKRMRLSKQISQ